MNLGWGWWWVGVWGGMTSLMLDLILNKFFCSNKNGCCFCLKVSVVWVEMVTYSGKTTRKPSSSLFVTARMEKGSTSAWLTGRVPAVKIHRFSWFFFTLCGDPFRRRYTTVYSYVGRNSIKSNYWCWMLKSGYKLTPCGWICQVRLTYFSTAPLQAVGVSAKYFSGRRLFRLVAFFLCVTFCFLPWQSWLLRMQFTSELLCFKRKGIIIKSLCQTVFPCMYESL